MVLRTTTDLEYIARVVSRGDDSRQESPTKTPATSVATQQNYDGFLYQCRVSPKISARVGGNRNGKSNGFRRNVVNFAVRSFPGNEIVVDLSNNPCVPVLNARTSFEGVKPVLSLYAGYQLGTISSRERGFF